MKARYQFTVIIAVYNAEEYLEEAINSLIQQSIGFENIQVILVDDGSTDRSPLICDQFANKYLNVLSFHQSNRGVSAARNAGLDHVEGEYVNFLDSDDKLSSNAMEEVANFFAEHINETDVVSIPMVFFDGKQGEHILNYKFEQGRRVIDLSKEYSAIQLSMSSTFIAAASLKGKKFDTRLAYAEDAKLLQTILMDKKALGVIPTATYFYRRHSNGVGSAIQSSTHSKAWYLPCMTYFQHDLVNTILAKETHVPKFIQFTLLYDLQWRIKMTKIPVGVLSEQEEQEYKALVEEMFPYFDDDVILAQKNIGNAYKLYILREKYGSPAKRLIQKDNIALAYGDRSVMWLSSAACNLEFLTVKKDRCVIEGSYELYEPCTPESKFQVRLGDDYYDAELIVNRKPVCALGTEILYRLGFRVELPLDKGMSPKQIHFYYVWNGHPVHCNSLRYGKFFPLTGVYANSYLVSNSWKLTKGRYCLHIAQVGRKEHLCCELRLLRELWVKNREGARKAAISRIARHAIKAFYKKQIWLISDRIMKADDNGEALFSDIQQTQKKNVRAHYVLSSESPDYDRLKTIGPVLNWFSHKHKFFVLLSDCIISAHAEDEIRNPFGNYADAYKDILSEVPFVFLQHGITKDDVSSWLGRWNKNISGFVTAAKPEYNSIVNGTYQYTSKEVWLTGFPRYDRLYHKEAHIITIMPTWRRYLLENWSPETDIWDLVPSFKESKYYQLYNKLLNSDKLLAAAQKCGYTLQFLPHPTIQPHINIFDHNDQVRFLSRDKHYRDVYAESNLIVTDYSSTFFDFAYLGKPVIYCQFDADTFFSGDHAYTKGYFDYERDGFGEVEYDLEHTIDRIIEYMETGCQMKDKYKQRVDNFFAFHDQNNCQRVYDKIVQMLAEKREP